MPDKSAKDEVIEYHAPKAVSLPRPSADSPLINLKPVVSSTLVQQMATINLSNTNGNKLSNSDNIPIGTVCKNSGCKQVILFCVLLDIFQIVLKLNNNFCLKIF